MKTIVFTCGGTGGHIAPALTLAAEMKKNLPLGSIHFLGRAGCSEEEWVRREGYPFHPIAAMPFKRGKMKENIRVIRETGRGVIDAFRHFTELKPDLVIGTGGYVSLPVYLAAGLKRIPLAIHESNSYAGLANRVGSYFADWIFLGFPEARRFFPRHKTRYSGNPIRPGICSGDRLRSREKFGLSASAFVLLIFGGSQGAQRINTVMAEMVPDLPAGIEIIWITGNEDHEKIKNQMAAESRVKVFPFIWNMHDAYAAADLAVSRAGALTVAELISSGLYSVYIPLAIAAENHQMANARSAAEAGMGAVLEEHECNRGRLLALVREQFQRRGEKIKNQALTIHRDAAATIVTAILKDLSWV